MSRRERGRGFGACADAYFESVFPRQIDSNFEGAEPQHESCRHGSCDFECCRHESVGFLREQPRGEIGGYEQALHPTPNPNYCVDASGFGSDFLAKCATLTRYAAAHHVFIGTSDSRNENIEYRVRLLGAKTEIPILRFPATHLL